MTHSDEFQKFKRIYYQDRLPIKSISYGTSDAESGMEASVIFEKEGSEIEISGTSQDFAEAIMTINKTVRSGDEMLVDLSDLPIENNDSYYQNLDVFLPDTEDPLADAVERVMKGESKVPRSVNLREALDASLDLDFENEMLQEVVKDYDDYVAVQLIQMKEFVD